MPNLLEKIVDFMIDLIGKEYIKEYPTYYTFPTVCHNKCKDTASHKLYLYKNPDTTPLFTCFTGCGDTFNIYTFIQRYYKMQGKKIDFFEAYKIFHGVEYIKTTKTQIIQEQNIPTFVNPAQIILPEYDDKILNLFPILHTNPWALEGIDINVLKKYRVGYSKSYEATIIPHYDYRGRLIGIRQRTTNEELARFMKYLPLKIGSELYSHPLSMNLYGLYHNQENIAISKTIILAEGEKSVLQAETMLKNNNVVAVCGSSISKWHKDMIVNYLQVENIIIAFDKEYKTFEERYKYIQNIKLKIGYMNNFANVFVLIDKKGIFKLQESPFDRTAKDFYELEYIRV